MRAWQRRITLSALIVLAMPILSALVPAGEDATITLGTDPEPPECIPPGGTIAVFWEVEYSTTPEFVYYCLMDPDLEVIEEETYPDDGGVAVEREWTVPPEAMPGEYWVHVEFWSHEVGHEATADVCFLVCDGTPVEGTTWGRIKSDFRR